MWNHELEKLEKQVAEGNYTLECVPRLVQGLRDSWTSVKALRQHIVSNLQVFRSYCEALDQYVPTRVENKTLLPLERIHLLGQRTLVAEERVRELEAQLDAKIPEREVQEVAL